MTEMGRYLSCINAPQVVTSSQEDFPNEMDRVVLTGDTSFRCHLLLPLPRGFMNNVTMVAGIPSSPPQV